MRLDKALLTDLSTALRSGPIVAFVALELLAGIVLVMRRGSEMASTVVLVWVGMAILAFFAWWAGRHRLAHPAADAVPGAGARVVFALVGVAGMLLVGFEVGVAAGAVLVVGGIGGWLWVAWRQGGLVGLRDRLTRDFRPFLPLLLLIALPRLLIGGPSFLVALVLALPSGIGQQLLYLLGLYAPLEALREHRAAAAVASATLFGLLHVPFLVEPNLGDLVAACANAVLFQASVGLIAVLAYQRHRAAVPIGVAHAMAIA